jgi:hypothetical protein
MNLRSEVKSPGRFCIQKENFCSIGLSSEINEQS